MDNRVSSAVAHRQYVRKNMTNNVISSEPRLHVFILRIPSTFLRCMVTGS